MPRSTNQLVLLQVDETHLGESMRPTINPGALLVDRGPGGIGITEARQIKRGAMYLVRPPEDEGLTVKRVFPETDRLILTSDNPDRKHYPPRTVPMKGHRLQEVVIGRVRWIGHEQDD